MVIIAKNNQENGVGTDIPSTLISLNVAAARTHFEKFISSEL